MQSFTPAGLAGKIGQAKPLWYRRNLPGLDGDDETLSYIYDSVASKRGQRDVRGGKGRYQGGLGIR